jgi:hypothetical protein
MTTHTRVNEVIEFADPYKVCVVCKGWVTGVTVPRYGYGNNNLPCWHHGYEDACPSWSPVDGCRCVEFLGRKPHGEPSWAAHWPDGLTDHTAAPRTDGDTP